MTDEPVEVASPLRECIIFCEVECVRPSCGIDAARPAEGTRTRNWLADRAGCGSGGRPADGTGWVVLADPEGILRSDAEAAATRS
ncbi:hypothetical protein GA0070215_13524 [Micromonospora marina]|uniref:Uncharacterized protein n=1 Tax=Micromonospora marina TaxID=307120 RepID=A0A1C5AJY5_9ACTN|nr:DUF6331 family protein [Micromonospora marina]SCF45548.1 hypothetical protein GA0070215_13524 [Micromonospora marina]